MNTDTLLRQFDTKIELFKQVKDGAKLLLSTGISQAHIKVHSIDSRIKGFDSFIDKIRRKKIKKPFEEIHDIVGLRVVCLFLDDIENINSIIERDFKIINKVDIIEEHKPDVFGYLGVQFIVKLKETGHLLKNKAIKDMQFEMQVRTIAQDVWASISHHLDYKKEYGIPDHLKRDFFALSGLFYVADTHFKIMKDEQIKYVTSNKL